MLLLLLAAPAGAATLVVDGSSYATITDALADASDGDRIEVAAGTWYECLDFGGKSVDLVGAGKSSTVLDGAGYCEVLVSVDSGEINPSLQSLTLKNGGELAIYMDAASLLLDDVDIDDVGSTAETVGAIDVASGDLTWTTGALSNASGERYGCAGVMVRDGASAALEDLGVSALSTYSYAACGEAGSSLSLLRVDVDGRGVYTFGEGSSEASSFTGNSGIALGVDSDWTSTDDSFEDLESGAMGVSGAASLVIDGGTFARNGIGIGIARDGETWPGTLKVSNSSFDDNGSSSATVGAIRVVDGFLELKNNTFTNNEGEQSGAVYCEEGLSDEGSRFEGNVGDDAGGMYVTGPLTLDGTEFSANEAVFGPAGLYWDEGRTEATMSATDCLFEDHADGYGVLYLTGEVAFDGCRFEGNSEDVIRAYEGPFEMSDTDFIDNTPDSYGVLLSLYEASVTGGLFSGNQETVFYSTDALTLRIDGATFRDNYTDRDGAAVDMSSTATMQILNSHFLDNEALASGGAVVGGWLELRNNYFCGNKAAANGGAVVAYSTEPWTNNIFVNNSASTGGAVVARNTGLVNNTFVGNSATEGGAAWIETNKDIEILNNIFAETGSGGALWGYNELSDDMTVTTYNLWWNNSSAHSLGTFNVPVTGFGNQEADPAFVAWSDDGDCSNDSFALSAGSPAIDKGAPSLYDADASRSDIGATGGEGSNWLDEDGDGWLSGFDCDDSSSAVNPGAEESCDGVDNDCDGLVDEADANDAQVWYRDADEDGYGDPGEQQIACDAPDGYTDNDQDCDDSDESLNLPSEEIPYDGIDQDCDGGDLTDVDDDGYDADTVGGDDCDDDNASIHPGATDVPGDGIDQDCDGSDAVDDSEQPSDDTGEPDAPSPSNDGGGRCSSTQAPAPGLGLLLMLSVLLVRRRRR